MGLPGIRSLARDLGVGRITVITAYDELAAEGYLVRRIGSGTLVAGRPPEVVPHALPLGPGPGSARATGPARREQRGPAFDLRPGRPELANFPVELWSRLTREAWRDLSRCGRVLAEIAADPGGDPLLREALATYAGASRGARAGPERIVVGTSPRSLVGALAHLLPGRAGTAVVEDPGDPSLRAVLAALGTRLVPVPVDDHGLQVHRLPDRADLVLVGPAWQRPRGGSLAPQRRAALLAWAAARDALIIEDDTGREIRFQGLHPTALQVAAEDRVVYVGDLGPGIHPGLSFGFAILPARVAAGLIRLLGLTADRPPAANQRALARFVAEGHLDRHLRRLRVVQAERQLALLEALRLQLGGFLSVAPAPTGDAIVATILDGRWSASAVAGACLQRGVAVAPVADFRLAPGPDRELVLSFTGHSPEGLAEAVSRMARAVAAGPERADGARAGRPGRRAFVGAAS